MPRSNIGESEITTTSAASFSLLARTKSSRCTLPTSSSPSMKNLMLSGSAPPLLQVRLDRLDVHEHLALVVGGAAGVDLAVADGGLEGRAGPQVHRIDRLHVVVAVEEDRRLARRVQPVAVDHGVARRLNQLDVLQSRGAQRVGRPLRRLAHVLGVLGQRRDAGNGQVLLQLLDVAIAIDVDEVDDFVHASMICHASPSRLARPSRSSFSRCASTPSCASFSSGSVSPG